jgi:hypothetical protein
MQLEIDPGDRQLSDEDRNILEGERKRVEIELRRRFGDVACEEHNWKPGVAVLDVRELPTVRFRFKDVCCEAMERRLLDAAKA